MHLDSMKEMFYSVSLPGEVHLFTYT